LIGFKDSNLGFTKLEKMGNPPFFKPVKPGLGFTGLNFGTKMINYFLKLTQQNA